MAGFKIQLNKMTSIVNLTLFTSLACAGSMGDIVSFRTHQPLISLSGGFANVHAGRSQAYRITEGDLFSYQSNGSTRNTGLVGVFLGEEFTQLSISPSLLFQAGLEYTYFGNTHFDGSNTVGIQPDTSTLYHYNYTLQSQQLLAVGKILASYRQIYHPYFSAGIGAAFNQSSHYNTYTFQTGSINITPTYHYKTESQFSYALGVGVDTTLTEHARLGLGYRFTDMGKASFENGTVVMNNYSYPTGFSLVMPHLYANQLIAQLSYLA